MEDIHHYTTIENLALILKSKKIRFTRLDSLDDIKETAGFEEYRFFAATVFISSWTEDEEENIPLWKMYASITNGVRISMPQNMFKQHSIDKFSTENHGMYINVISPFTKEETFYNGKYQIVNFFKESGDDFYKAVEYRDDFPELYRKSITRTETGWTINRLWDLGKYKSKKWEFQKEARFTLYIRPLDPRYKHDPIKQQDSGIDPALIVEDKYIDTPLDDNVFKNMTITLAPLVNDAQKIIVQSLKDKYCPDACIKESSLTGHFSK